MKEFKGTPGSWEYERGNDVLWDGEDESYWEYFAICDENRDEVARCDDEHDARLIAAAPELLEELQDLVARCRIYVNTTDAQAAIAKALGETK